MGVRNLFALFVYCLVFSFLFITIYPALFEDPSQRRAELLHPGVTQGESEGDVRSINKASLVLNVARQRGWGVGRQRSLQAETLAGVAARRTTQPPTLPIHSYVRAYILVRIIKYMGINGGCVVIAVIGWHL